MNLRSACYAIRKYGIKGLFNYISRLPKEWLFFRSINKTIRPSPPERGITLITCFDYPGSLSKVMRDFAIMLKEAGVPYQTLNVPCDNPIPKSELESFMTPKHEFCLNKYTHIITMQNPLHIQDNRCHVHCIEFWEFEDGFVECCPEALRASNILALSDFNRDVFRKSLPSSIAVQKVLYPFQFVHGELLPRNIVRTKYNIGIDDFMVFFNFDYASSYFRKNPEGILKAFAKSLGNKPNTTIVFKTMRAKKCKVMSDRLHVLADSLGLSEKLITIDDFIPQEDLVNFTNACDVYVSLHRGEGFGLGIAEAMSLGKAVIVTNYSSTAEFCTQENSIPIPYKIVAVPPDQVDVDAYRNVTKWADPDISSAADALLRLYNDSDLRFRLGRKAMAFIQNHYSITNFKKSIESFLTD